MQETTNGRRRDRREDPVQVPATIDGRPPPNDVGAEQAVISAAMLDGRAADIACDVLRFEQFYSEAHRVVFRAVWDLHARNEPLDSVQVASELQRTGRLQQIGGMEYIARLLSAAPAITEASVRAYATRVHETWRERQLIFTCQRVSSEGYLPHGDTREWIAGAEEILLKATGDAQARGAQPLVDVVRQNYETLVHAQTKGIRPGIPTGLLDLDDVMTAEVGDLTVIAGRPGMGKTGLMLSIALATAKAPRPMFTEDGSEPALYGVGFLSLEMPSRQIGYRAMALEGEVNVTAMRHRNLTPDQWRRLAGGCQAIQTIPLLLDDQALDISQLRSAVRKMKAQFDRGFGPGRTRVRLSAIHVDYMQRMKAAGKRSREEEVATIARELKETAKEEGVHIFAGAQLNRKVDERKGAERRPTLADLRESGAIEQEADNIVFIYRPEFYKEPVAPGDEGLAELIIGKQRSGPTTTVKTRFDEQYTRFRNF